MRRERIIDWQAQLNGYITDAQSRYKESGLVWGEFDCCTFAFDWVHLCTGLDPMKPLRGKYSSQDEALLALRKHGSGTLKKTVTDLMSAPLPPAQCRRGDIAYRSEEKALGIIINQGHQMVAVFLSEGGFSVLPTRQVDCGFPV